MNEETLFELARNTPADERAALLDRECAGRPDLRTRIISLVSGDVLLNVIPPSVDLERIVYTQEPKSVRVTDGSAWHLDLSEMAWQ